MSIVFDNIEKKLKELNIPYETWDHKAVYTSEEAAKVRGFDDARRGAKALLFKTKEGTFIMVVCPANERVDSKKIKKLEGTKDLKLASPEEVLEITGVEIGCVTPFGSKTKVKTYVKSTVFDIEFIYLNPGLHTRTLKIKGLDMKKCMQDAIVYE